MSLCARGQVRYRGRSMMVSARHKCRSARMMDLVVIDSDLVICSGSVTFWSGRF